MLVGVIDHSIEYVGCFISVFIHFKNLNALIVVRQVVEC